MKYLVLTLTILMMAVGTGLSQSQASKESDGPKDKVGYSIGVSIGKNFKTQGIQVDLESLFEGLKESYTGKDLKMSEQEMSDTMQSFQKMAMARQMENAKKAGEKNKKEGEEFLAVNCKKDSVVTLPDGLQYKVIREGTGKKPTMEDTVTVVYRGCFVDGTEFDSSIKHGGTSTFPLGHVIKGWTEGLQMMSPGAKYQFFIPSNLAYGEAGRSPVIPPNSTLVFELELVSFK